VIASYKFEWQGNTIITKTFVLKLRDDSADSGDVAQ
jgi:hypothetical protein